MARIKLFLCPDNASEGQARHDSPRIFGAFDQLGVEIAVEEWDGSPDSLSEEEACIVLFGPSYLGHIQAPLAQGCTKHGHLLIHADEILSQVTDQRIEPELAVRDWVAENTCVEKGCECWLQIQEERMVCSGGHSFPLAVLA